MSTGHITQKFLKNQSVSEWAKLTEQAEKCIENIKTNEKVTEDVKFKLEEMALKFAKQLVLDFVILKNESIVLKDKVLSDCALHSFRKGSKYCKKSYPIRIDKLIKTAIYKEFLAQQKVEFSKLKYNTILSNLSQAIVQQAVDKFYKTRNLQTCKIRGLWPKLKTCSLSADVKNPKPMPVVVSPLNDFDDFLQFLSQNKKIDVGKNDSSIDDDEWKSYILYKYKLGKNDKTCLKFNRGALYEDGRLDLCKQVIGPEWITNLMNSLKNNTEIRHFLLGNNIIGESGCKAIHDFLKNDHMPKIQTWYLAGNEINSNGLEMIADALSDDKDLRSLWLKRNPITANGAMALKKLLQKSETLKVLDLSNTAIALDEIGNPCLKGIEDLCQGLKENKSLRYLYLSANGINKDTVVPLVKYFYERQTKGITSLWIDMNALDNDGMILLLASLKNYKWIKRLFIGSNKIDHESVEILVNCLKNHTNFRVLNLAPYKSTVDMGAVINLVGDKGADLFVDFIKNSTTIVQLNLSTNGISSQKIESLMNTIIDSNVSLVSVNLSQSKSDNACVSKQLKKRLAQKLNANQKNSDKYSPENWRHIQHSKEISFIDSIYRNNDKI